jgi:hypothetical protein
MSGAQRTHGRERRCVRARPKTGFRIVIEELVLVLEERGCIGTILTQITIIFVTMKRRISSLISAVIFLLVVWVVLDRLHIVMWVQTPWWAFLLMGVVLFLLIDFVVSRVFKNN